MTDFPFTENDNFNSAFYCFAFLQNNGITSGSIVLMRL